MLKKRKWQNHESDRCVWPGSLFFLPRCLMFLCSQLLQFPVSHQPHSEKVGRPQGCNDLCVGMTGSAAVSSPRFPLLRRPQAWLPQCLRFCSCKAASINTVVTTAFKICDQETKGKRKQEWIAEEMLDWMFSGYEAYIKYFLWLPIFTSSIYHHY